MRLLMALISLLVLSCAVAPPAAVAEEKRAPRELVFAESDDPSTLDPHRAGDVISSRHCGLIYESLLEYNPFSPGKLQPCLASEMPQFDEEKKSYTFKLRDDVCFANDACFKSDKNPEGNGRKLVAADFVYSFKRLAALPQSEGFWMFENKISGLDEFRYKALKLKGDDWRKHLAKDVAGLQAPDERTLVITLTESYPQLLYALALTFGAAVAHEACELYGADFLSHPVGTGPFVLGAWKKDEELVYRRNPAYREIKLSNVPSTSPLKPCEGQRLPLSDSVRYLILKDSADFDAFFAGRIHACGIGREHFSKVIDAEAKNAGRGGDDLLKKEFRQQGVRLRVFSEPTLQYIAFNMRDSLVGERAEAQGRAIRKALALSIDREAYIRDHLNGRGMVASQLVPPGMMGHDARNALAGQKLDAAEGRQLLTAAGYKVEEVKGSFVAKDETGKQIELTLVLRSATAEMKEQGKFFTACAGAVGIKLKVECLTFSEYLKRQDQGIDQAYSAAWVMDYPDPQNIMQLLYGPNESPGINAANFFDKEYDELYEQLSRVEGQNDMQALTRGIILKRMHEILDEETPWVLLNFTESYSLYREGLKRPPPDSFNYTSTKCMVFEK